VSEKGGAAVCFKGQDVEIWNQDLFQPLSALSQANICLLLVFRLLAWAGVSLDTPS
jgi:hypothetical protein